VGYSRRCTLSIPSTIKELASKPLALTSFVINDGLFLSVVDPVSDSITTLLCLPKRLLATGWLMRCCSDGPTTSVLA
jgi:hypothetical protein